MKDVQKFNIFTYYNIKYHYMEILQENYKEISLV